MLDEMTGRIRHRILPNYRIDPDVVHHESAFFGNAAVLPAGSVAFDCALVMRDLAHGWVRHDELCAVCA